MNTINSTLPNPVLAGTTVTVIEVFRVPNVTLDASGNVTIGPGVATDPTTTELKVSCSNAVGGFDWTYGVTGSISKLQTGAYQGAINTTGMSGIVTVEWIGTGACAFVHKYSFVVVAP